MATKTLLKISLNASVAAIFAATSFNALAQDRVVNIYNWSDYIDEAILREFTVETGIKVRYDVFDSNEVLETKLLAGGTGYDVVVPSGTFLSRQITAGIFKKLDQSKLSNMGNLWDMIAQRTSIYDPGNAYSINYMWGTTGIGVNIDKVKAVLGEDAPVDSLALIFDPANMEKLQSCGVQILDAPSEIVPAVLAYLGEEPDSHDADIIAKAEPILAAVRPYVQKFHSSEYINALANGDICVAFGWSGDILQARDRADEAGNGVVIEYNSPKEGALMWFDQMAIPTDAPHLEEAHEFINYILRAEVMAKASNYVYYANGNEASQPFLEADVIGDTAIYPNEETLKNLYITTAYGNKTQRVVTRMWTRILTGK